MLTDPLRDALEEIARTKNFRPNNPEALQKTITNLQTIARNALQQHSRFNDLMRRHESQQKAENSNGFYR